MITIITWHRKNIYKVCKNRNIFPSNTTQWLLSMGNQVVNKIDFAKLCFSLLGMPVLLKNLFISLSLHLHLVFLMFTPFLRQVQCRNYYKHSHMKTN